MPNELLTGSFLWLALVTNLAVLAPAEAQEAPRPILTPLQLQREIESFDLVWMTIHDKHFDPKFNGVDWTQVRDELRPKMERATSMTEARDLLQQMIDRLKQSHFSIIPSEAYGAMGIDRTDERDDGGQSGLQVRVIDGQAIVVAVEPDSPAATAGIKPGWIIVRVRGELLKPVIDKVDLTFRSSTQREFRLMVAVSSRIRGKVGDRVALELLDGNDKPSVVKITLASPRGVPVRFGNLPTFYVKFESRMIDKSVLYVRLNAFFDLIGVIKGLGESIKAHSAAEGLVLDLRGNPGGIAGMAMGMGGWLVSRSDSKLGTLLTRDSRFNLFLNPRPGAYGGPVAVLVDGCSMSTSEILAGGLRDLGRARIFGTRSGGAALPSVVIRLPNGDTFQYAFANYISTGGRRLEGEGVTVDTEVPLTRKALLEGRDPVVEAAIAWIHAQKRHS